MEMTPDRRRIIANEPRLKNTFFFMDGILSRLFLKKLRRIFSTNIYLTKIIKILRIFGVNSYCHGL